jgi:hypothetical protein
VLLPQAVAALARLGSIDRAIALVGEIQNPFRAATPLAVVATSLAKQGRAEEAHATARRAADAARAIGGAFESDVLAKVLQTLVAGGMVQEAVGLANNAEELAASLLAKRGLFELLHAEVLRVDAPLSPDVLIGAAWNAVWRAPYLLAELITALEVQNRTAGTAAMIESVAVAGKDESPASRANRLLFASHGFAKVGERQRSADLAIEVGGGARHEEDPRVRDELLIGVVERLSEAARHEAAVDWCERIESPPLRARALLAAAAALVASQQKEGALALANRVASEAERTDSSEDSAVMWVDAAWAFARAGEGRLSALALVRAFLAARLAGRASVWNTLDGSLPLLAATTSDQPGEDTLLWSLHQGFVEVDSWWSTE